MSHKENTYKLHKEYKPKNFKIVNIPPELKKEYNQINLNKMVRAEFGGYLKEFIKVMTENFKNEDLINFYNNINTLKVSYSKFKLKKFIFRANTTGCYNIKNNLITVDENDTSKKLFHELFHMSSSIYKNGLIYSGFYQTSLKTGLPNLGIELNEGYTELLNRRYFVGNNNVVNSYEYEVFIAGRLEHIIGKEKMESLYLNANLPGLIQELNKYSTEEEIMEFLSITDFILNHLDDKKFKLFEKDIITNSLTNINKFLIKAYFKKLLPHYKQKKLTYEQITTQLSNYVASLPSKLTSGKRVYKVISKEDLVECFVSVLDKSNISFTANIEEDSFLQDKNNPSR